MSGDQEIIDEGYRATLLRAFGILCENLATSDDQARSKFESALKLARSARKLGLEVCAKQYPEI